MGKRIAWCKENLLHAVTLFLLAFIPLYPKLPLIDIIRSWVYIRLEDFFIGLAILILGWIYIRNKQVPDSPLTKPITVYWIVGFISLVHALIFIFPHVPGTFAHLGILHYLRRIEYMAVCFLAF